jgi:DNA-binding CsgD family transcriptional regulator
LRTIPDVGQRNVLRGRSRERALLDQMLERAGAGRGGVLVLRGEPGIGKTALLDDLVERASGWQVVRAVGVQSDMELAFAALHQLCSPLLDGLQRLPAPQREAICVAFGLTVGPAPDRFLVGLGVLGLLSVTAAARPVVCVVDDAQWLDRTSAQVLGFVARRLQAESVVLLFAVRAPSELEELAGLPELLVEGLDDADARALLASVITGRVDEQVVERIVAETRGNPLALLELPRGLSLGELAGGFGVSAAPSPSARIEERFLTRLRALPAETQQLLLLAAAEPVGDPELLWRAAAQLGLGADAAAPAELAGLLELGSMVRFRHPLVRSAVYAAAPLDKRQQAHRALAEATDWQTDPDRRVWHLAQAALGPDEDVAAELERSANRATARGGLAAAAAFLARAAALTPDFHARARRALAAAQAHEQAGAPHVALASLATVETWPLDQVQRSLLERLRGQIAVHLYGGGGDAAQQLLTAARRLEVLDLPLAHETYLEAMYAAAAIGAWPACAANSSRSAQVAVAQAVRAAPPLPPPQPATDVLLDGLAVRFTDGYVTAAPILKQALCALRDQQVHADHGVRWLSLALRTAMDLFDDDTWHELATRQVQAAREAGALSVLPTALAHLAHLRISEGDLDAAGRLKDEADAITDATGNARVIGSLRFLLAAYQDDLGAPQLIETGLREEAGGAGWSAPGYLDYASAVLNNGLGRYESAMHAAQRARAAGRLAHSTWALPELVEAAGRAGQAPIAAAALHDLAARAQASQTAWALGLEARSRALLAEGRIADGLYREAIRRLEGTRVVLELARARLLYGEWLRRERRRLEAREQLRAAHEQLAGIGARVFAQRARRELLATGERARRRVVETNHLLTWQEHQVASMARDGYSNQEIGGRLFISPKTVEYHLHKAFSKLAITSRYQLEHVLPRD